MIYNACQRPFSVSSLEGFSLKLFTDVCGNFKDYSSIVHTKTSYQLKSLLPTGGFLVDFDLVWVVWFHCDILQ